MMVLERQAGTKTWAIFTAVIAGDGRTATGQLINQGGNYGTMLMIKREVLADYQHLLMEERRQSAQAQRLKGIEQLEAGIEPERLQNAKTYWWKLDRNKDGYVSYEEFPHPDWHRANLNSDEFLSWEEELIDIAMRRVAQLNYQEKYATSQKEWSSWHKWASDRSDFEWLFPFIDRDHDGKISADEYKAFEAQAKEISRQILAQNERVGTNGTGHCKQAGARSVERRVVRFT